MYDKLFIGNSTHKVRGNYNSGNFAMSTLLVVIDI